LGSKIKKGEMGEHVARTGEVKNVYRTSVGDSEVKRLLKEPMCMWKDNIEMDLKVMWWQSVE
jgi:hypothetical protein